MKARTRMILAVVAIVVVGLAFYFFMISPRKAELAKVETEIETEQIRTAQLTSELTRLQELQERAPKLRLELAKIRQLVPVRHEVPNFIFLVQAASNAAGVDFLTISPTLPGPPAEGAAVAEVQISINAEGSYFSLQDFIRRLYTLDRALRMDIISLTGSATGDASGATRLSASMNTRIFFQPPAPPPAPAAPAPAEGEPAPTETPVAEGA